MPLGASSLDRYAAEAHRTTESTHAATAAAPTRLDRWLAVRLQATIAPARVRVVLWGGFSPGLDGDAIGDLVVADRRALLGLLLNPDLEFGEQYVAGRIAIRGDLAGALEALSRLSAGSPPSLKDRLSLWCMPANDLLAARRNIHHHYDLGNDFYQLWLDPRLVYTCAYYPTLESPLEAAQTAKLDLICRKLKLQPGERVIEAGCGWGALALHMARHYGVVVRAFNISVEQIAFAREQAARAGLSDRVEFVEDDYRAASGTFDAFVSIGMLEHVGRRNLSAFSDVVRRTLDRRSGRGLLHFIGRDRPRPVNAWIRRRIFPGGYVPALAEITARVLEPANLSVLDVENLRMHYARTLFHWRERFEQVEMLVRSRFGEPFCRAWRLYLAGSEAAFSTGHLQLFQIVFAPSAGRIVHWTRDPLYTPFEENI